MQHPRSTNATSATAAQVGGASSSSVASGAAGSRLGLRPSEVRGIALGASRELRAPLASLRVLLEGQRRNKIPQVAPFTDRAIQEIERAEAAAHDLMAWSNPRNLRAIPTTLSEIVESLRSTLSQADRRRTHFVVEQGETALFTDAPLLVESFERCLRHSFRAAPAESAEIMVHVHAAADDASFSFVHTNTEPTPAGERSLPSLADALLRESVLRLGGKASEHNTEGHRCSVITLPLGTPLSDHTEAAQ